MERRCFSALLSLALLSLLVGLAAVRPVPAVAAGTTLYVDGKNGNDGNNGRTWGAAYRTINRAAREIPRGNNAAGWTVIVRGYEDYVYRERAVPGGYDRRGVAGSPVVFMAEGWSAGGTDYVKPIVSGALVAPRQGRSWQADATKGVWWTSWSTTPVNFDKRKPYSSALYQNTTKWLWQHASLADLRNKAGRHDGGYWWDSSQDRLYVATKGGVAPGSVLIEVPTTKAFYFSGTDGAAYISVRGFVVKHTEMGISFHLGADHSSALDNVAIGNTPTGFATSGRRVGSGADPGTDNAFLRNVAMYNTLQGFKIDAGSKDTVVCGNNVHHNALQGIKLQGSDVDANDARVTSGTEICDNVLAQQAIKRPGGSRVDEQPNGLTISNGARGTNVHDNVIRGNLIGIQVNHRGQGSPVDNTRIVRNQIFGNRSAGLSLRDGVKQRSWGTGSLYAAHNVYWDNGVGVRVAPGSTNKTFDHETIYSSTGNGMEVGCACTGGAARVTLRNSLLTHNHRYGVLVASGHRATLSHVGLNANGAGAIRGPASKTAVNTRRPGYISVEPASGDYLRIGTWSYQYTAGPNDSPIGARY
ncbi:MAG TPA: right-handed parallel beta-helix repeat-containing protein [Candidatus Limnocylindria bacterium]